MAKSPGCPRTLPRTRPSLTATPSLDTLSVPRLVFFVLPLRRIVALVLLSLWLPATLHCQLEAAGCATLFTCTTDHHDSSPNDHDQPHRDSCDILEAATFKPAANPTIAPHRLPAWDAPIFVRPTPTLGELPVLVGVVDCVAPPPEISPTWHFITRAALPARAPSRS